MFKSFASEGKWFLPETPEKKFYGKLTFSPEDGARLELKGALGKGFREPHNIILGISDKGKDITLNDCYSRRREFSAIGDLLEYYANRVFVGAHFNEEQDIKFKEMQINYANLDEWLGVSGFANFKRIFGNTLTIKHTHPKPIHAVSIEPFDLCFVFRRTGPTLTLVQKEISIQQKAYLKIESKRTRPVSEFLGMAHKFQNLLSFAVTKPVSPTTISGISPGGSKKDPNKMRIVDIYFCPLYVGADARAVFPPLMLFTFADIRKKKAKHFRNWFRSSEDLKPVHDLYFATIYRPKVYAETRFLGHIQAIEAYHRRRMRNFNLPKEEHARLVSGILSSFPNYKEWLEQKIAYSNEPTLRARLKMLWERFPEIMGKYVRQKRYFIDKVVTTRNYLTHYDEELKHRAVKGADIHHYSERLKILLEAILLKEIGFTLDDIKKCIDNKYGTWIKYKGSQEKGKSAEGGRS